MKKIERIARQFRNALDAAWEDDMFRNLYPFNNFPNDCCGHTCDLLSQYLLEHGIELLKDKIKKIYDNSHQNYGAPKITRELHKTGENISERTVGKYMKQMGIKAQWIRPWTVTTKDSDFSNELQNILDEQFNP